MKKLISVLLILAIALTLFACGGKPADENNGGAAGNAGTNTEPVKRDGLYIGYGRADIMPEQGVPTPLGGYGSTDNRLSSQFLDILQATCLAVTDPDGETALIFTQDLIQCYADFFNGGRKAVSEATKVPENRIFFAATHTHSAPDTSKPLGENAAIDAYYEIWRNGVVEAATEAIADQKKVSSMGAGKIMTEKMTYDRHYKHMDGTYAGDNFGTLQIALVEDYAEKADEEMIVLQIDREGQEKPIVLVNFQMHPCMTGGATETTISADVIASCRDYMEKEMNVDFAYFTGAAGNQNLKTYIGADMHSLDYKTYGKALGDYAAEALKNLEPITGTDLKINQQVYNGEIFHAMEDKYEQALEIKELFAKTGDRTTATIKAQEYGFASVYQCNAIVRRKDLPATMDMELNAISIGDFALITAPYEMFSVNAFTIKEGSPYKYTFILTNAGENRSYIPSQLMYEKGCYESHTANYAPGTGEKVADYFVQMLKDLKG